MLSTNTNLTSLSLRTLFPLTLLLYYRAFSAFGFFFSRLFSFSLSHAFDSSASQERLLLSLLPAHIARVMKAEIIQRLQGPNFGRTESTNNFHNLYVQRHTNVR